jgi:tRNA(Ser,Leu) C12 N-acetylase TAN1
MSKLRKFITTCTLTFKTFDFDVKMNESKATLWNFTVTNPPGDKKYCVFCAATVGKAKGIIKVTLKKIPTDYRLVVVVESHNDQELEEAAKNDYTLVSLSTLNSYGQEMLTIREIESAAAQEDKASEVRVELNKSNEDFIDKVINKDRLF